MCHLGHLRCLFCVWPGGRGKKLCRVNKSHHEICETFRICKNRVPFHRNCLLLFAFAKRNYLCMDDMQVAVSASTFRRMRTQNTGSESLWRTLRELLSLIQLHKFAFWTLCVFTSLERPNSVASIVQSSIYSFFSSATAIDGVVFQLHDRLWSQTRLLLWRRVGRETSSLIIPARSTSAFIGFVQRSLKVKRGEKELTTRKNAVSRWCGRKKEERNVELKVENHKVEMLSSCGFLWAREHSQWRLS